MHLSYNCGLVQLPSIFCTTYPIPGATHLTHTQTLWTTWECQSAYNAYLLELEEELYLKLFFKSLTKQW